MEENRREIRSWSIEPRDRRVHAVSPMHLQEGRLLNSLLHEAQSISSSNNKINAAANGNEKEKMEDAQLQKMLDKYQQKVLQQQQRMASGSNHEIIKSFASSSSAPPQVPPMSHSQPCLITIADQKNELSNDSAPPSYPHASSSFEPCDVREAASLKAKFLSSQKLISALQEENNMLKQQCEFLKKKASRLQQLETAYETIEREYENLNAQKERQDNLEKAARTSLEKQLARYVAENDLLHERIEELSQRIQLEPQAEQLNKLTLLLSDTISQNKELMADKERKRKDIDALEVTLKDQRNHIMILEKALSNTREKVWRKEKEIEELSGGAERAAALQRALEKAVLDKQKREEEWNRERAQLEMENAQLKMQLAKESVAVGVKKGATARSPDSEETLSKLKKALHAKDGAISQLESKVMELEAKLHEETQRNKMAIATQSDTLSGKLKKMEEEKTEKDRKIAELTEEKERLFEKLEDERKTAESRTSLFEREIDRIRNGDDRRFREDMARMEQMKYKIADRRCFTAGRRTRFNNHGRTSSGSRAGSIQNHVRTHSASALLPSEIPLSIHNSSSTAADIPLDLSSGRSPPKLSMLHSSSYSDAFLGESPSEQLYKASLASRYSRPMSIPFRYDVSFSDSENLISQYSSKFTEKYGKQLNVDEKSDEKEKQEEKPAEDEKEKNKPNTEEVWNV